MEMGYNLENMDNHLSMGENALLYYDDILEKDVLNRIIIGTIFRLHKKGYVELTVTKEKELAIKIKNGTEKLRISETFIYECLKFMDTDENSILKIHEFTACENDVLAKHKNNIKELIIKEAMTDELIDTKKYKNKRKHFFRAFESLVILMMPTIIGLILGFPVFMLFLVSLCVYIRCDKFIYNSMTALKNLKKELLNDELMKYGSKTEFRNRIIEFAICIIVYLIHFYCLEKFTSIDFIYEIETLIFLTLAIVEYIKFHKADVYTEKAICNRQKLKGLEVYLEEYSLIETRKTLEIYLWEDYLTFSVLLGVNNQITNEIRLNFDHTSQK